MSTQNSPSRFRNTLAAKSSALRSGTASILRMRPFLVTALALSGVTAGATDGRYREYVVGDRTGGMGGAAIAVANDVDAVFYNPAGLSQSSGDSISLSANLYGVENYKTKGGFDWGADSKSDSFVSIPAAMGGVKRISDEWVAGFGAFAPKMEKRHIVACSIDRTQFSHVDYDDQTLWIGPAIAWAPADSRYSVGAGLFAVYRDYSLTESSFQANGHSLSGAFDLSTLGLIASLGVQADLGDGWRVGATIQTPSLRVWDDGTLSMNGVMREGDAGFSLGMHTSDVRADNYIPLQLGLGVGRTVPGKWGFAFDTIYHPSKKFDFARWNINGDKYVQTLHLHSVLDMSLGGEYIVAERFPIRAGVYTALSSIRVPEDPDSSDFSTSDVDMYGVTFSVGRRENNMAVNVGFDYAFGDGHDLKYGTDGGKVRADCDRDVFLLTISTTYYF